MKHMIALNYIGAQRDGVTAAYPLGNGARWYMPSLMRFNAPDTQSPFQMGGPNPYAYCDDDPIDRVDPNGHFNWSVAVRAIKRFLSPPGTRERNESISAAVASGAPVESTASGGERPPHAVSATKRASIGAEPASDEDGPMFYSLSDPEPGPNFQLYRPVTLVQKIGLFTGAKVLGEHILVTTSTGKTSMLPLEGFKQHYSTYGTENLESVDGVVVSNPLRNRTRVCVRKLAASSVEPAPPLRRWFDSESPNSVGEAPVRQAAYAKPSDDEFDFFPSSFVLGAGEQT